MVLRMSINFGLCMLRKDHYQTNYVNMLINYFLLHMLSKTHIDSRVQSALTMATKGMNKFTTIV